MDNDLIMTRIVPLLTGAHRTRFEQYFSRPGTGCWLWHGATWDGYGVLFWQAHKRNYRAHRLAWRLYRGEIPDGLFVLHRCDVRTCVNPDHLFLGTARENNQDARNKGRYAFRGLSDSEVRTVKLRLAAGEQVSRIAREFGVSRRFIRMIRSGDRRAEVA